MHSPTGSNTCDCAAQRRRSSSALGHSVSKPALLSRPSCERRRKAGDLELMKKPVFPKLFPYTQRHTKTKHAFVLPNIFPTANMAPPRYYRASGSSKANYWYNAANLISYGLAIFSHRRQSTARVDYCRERKYSSGQTSPVFNSHPKTANCISPVSWELHMLACFNLVGKTRNRPAA